MRSTYRTVAVLGLAPLCLAMWGPAGLAQTAAEPAATEAATEAAAPEITLGAALAEVNGVTLTLGELIVIRQELPDQYQSLPDEVLFNGLVEQLVDLMLLADAAGKAGLDRRPAVALSLLNQRRATLADAYLRREIAARITPEVIEALYQERYLDAELEQEVKAAHILVESAELANDLKVRLDGGADFAVLAAEHGTDGTATRGGDLGWFVHSDMVPEFANVAFAMELGAVSDPVKTTFGWHLIRLDQRRDRAPPALEDVRAVLMRELVKRAQIAVVEDLREQAEIVMPEPPLPVHAIRADAMLDGAE